MSWILPSAAAVLRHVGRDGSGRPRPPSYFHDRHRPGYWRDYHARNLATRRPYLTKKAREYRAAKTVQPREAA